MPFNRVAFAAAHVVADPVRQCRSVGSPGHRLGANPRLSPPILLDLGFGIAEAMDTSQRGMGLDWAMRSNTFDRSSRMPARAPA